MVAGAGRENRGNLFLKISVDLPLEIVEVLRQTGSFRLERIISTGQATPEGEWYDQDTHEWVLLLSGEAGLRLENDPQVIIMKPGDYINIPAHCRHRVEWTDPSRPTIWLALHYGDG